MSDSNLPREFLSYVSDDDLRQNPVRPALDTLFSEFARRHHRSLSPSTQSSPRSARSHPRHAQQFVDKQAMIDLRALEYAVEYDSHLMCPICHVPFIEPIVLDCDHTFCTSCFSEYKRGATNSERSQCPSCRSLVLSSPRKASRLIYNMCNDIRVRCPNEGCEALMARGHIERHATKLCPEQLLACPSIKCDKRTKRKNYVPEQCIHDNQVECDCGEILGLGRGDWLRHRDEHCPNTGTTCEYCGVRVSSRDYKTERHDCRSDTGQQHCPGADVGCTDEVEAADLESHVSTCTFARLAPYLKSQSQLLHSTQEQLASSKIRNESLELELERMNHLLITQIQPRLDHVAPPSHSSDAQHDDQSHENENDVEEIPRDSIPSAAAIHHRDLLLPAHIRDLTPSPDFFPGPSSHPQSQIHAQNQAHMHNHLLSLHENLRHTVSNLEADMNSLHHALAELDARTSMQILNETMRIKEDLAYTNAALVSHRSQVQWLLNRERIGREQALLRERGRLGGQGQAQRNQGSGGSEEERQGPNLASPGTNTSAQSQSQLQPDTFPFPTSGAGMTRTVSGSGGGSGPSSAATSPMFTGIGLSGSRRPSMRGGSQERVKL